MKAPSRKLLLLYLLGVVVSIACLVGATVFLVSKFRGSPQGNSGDGSSGSLIEQDGDTGFDDNGSVTGEDSSSEGGSIGDISDESGSIDDSSDESGSSVGSSDESGSSDDSSDDRYNSPPYNGGSGDSTDNGCSSAGCVTELLNVTVSSPEEAINATREALVALIGTNRRLSPLFVRLGFHDCIGGCDGCLDLNHFDNRGIGVAVDALQPVVDAFAKTTGGEDRFISRADIWALAAVVGADVAQTGTNERVDFNFSFYGRLTCEEIAETNEGTCLNEASEPVPCDARNGPHRAMPSPDLTTHGVLDFFSQNFGFNMQETVAIMGAHTLGRLQRTNSGFHGPNGWVNRNHLLDNAYYRGLVGGNSIDDAVEDLMDAPNWVQRRIDNTDLSDIPDRHQWNRGGGRQGGNRDLEEHGEERNLRGGGRGGPHGGMNCQGNGGRALGRGMYGCGHGHSHGGRGSSEVMINADISLVRNMTSYLDSQSGQVSCDFEQNNYDPPGTVVCPAARTLPQMAVYRFSNTIWLQDFRSAFGKMLLNGYMVPQTCDIDSGLCGVLPIS